MKTRRTALVVDDDKAMGEMLVSLLEDHTPPWWNPLLAGGMPQFAHPSDGSMSPLILPSVLFGEALGMKLNIVLVALLGRRLFGERLGKGVGQ